MSAGATSAIKHQVSIAAPIDSVWDLVSTAAGWNRWATVDCVLEPRAGGRFSPEWRSSGADGRAGREDGRVLNIDAPRHVAFERTLSGGVRTRFTLDLRPDRDGTNVRLSDHGHPVGTHAEIIAFGNAACGWGEALTLLKFSAEQGMRHRPVEEVERAAPVEAPAPKRRRGKQSAA